MSINVIIILLAIGLLAGFTSGIMGVGGAIIMVPAMVFFLGMTQYDAQGTSMAVLLLPTGILAFMNYYHKGFVNIYYAVFLIIAFVVGSYFGSLLAINLPANVLKKIFAILLLVVGIKMFFSK